MPWEAIIEAAKLGCGVLLLGGKKYAFVDEERLEELEETSWNADDRGYTVRTIGPYTDRRKQYLHRFLMKVPPGKEVDHINLRKWDNRSVNLRCAERFQNRANTLRRRHNSESKFKGVRRNRNGKRWNARGMLYGKEHHLGVYDTEEEAARAYNRWAVTAFGEFANLNPA